LSLYLCVYNKHSQWERQVYKHILVKHFENCHIIILMVLFYSLLQNIYLYHQLRDCWDTHVHTQREHLPTYTQQVNVHLQFNLANIFYYYTSSLHNQNNPLYVNFSLYKNIQLMCALLPHIIYNYTTSGRWRWHRCCAKVI
jgi:hypothetical protein